MLPKARSDRLLVQQVGQELVVYDQARHRAHRLNPTAALVWRRCDGLTTPAAMAAALSDTFGVDVGEDVVQFALDRLDDKHLLRGHPGGARSGERLSRRDALRRLGRTAAGIALVPVVATLVAPTPSGAQSELAATGCVSSCGGTCMSISACAGDASCKSCTGARPCGCPGSDVCCRPT